MTREYAYATGQGAAAYPRSVRHVEVGMDYCVEAGCTNIATHSRPEGMVGDTFVVELVCEHHAHDDGQPPAPHP